MSKRLKERELTRKFVERIHPGVELAATYHYGTGQVILTFREVANGESGTGKASGRSKEFEVCFEGTEIAEMGAFLEKLSCIIARVHKEADQALPMDVMIE